MIRINLDNSPYVSQETGRPIDGRLTVYMHGTDTLARTWTLEGNSYVQAQNPVLVRSGYPQSTLFVEIGLYDLKVERYTGPDGQMSVDSPYYADEDVFQFGFDYDISTSAAVTVDDMAGLRAADPSVGSVTVLSYASEGDCVPRRYVWDGASTDSEDGGYVVASERTDEGRWILLWDSGELPATVYGVFPGDEGNMGLLLSYPSTVGSFALSTAPAVYFPRGEYTSALHRSTDKELVFGSGARFTGTVFSCPRARVSGESVSYVADFEFTAPDAVAHSSWFQTVDGFWSCGAHTLCIDATNWFTSTLVNSNHDLSGKVVSGSSRIAVTYASGRYFSIDQTTAILGRVFSAADYVRVTGHGDGFLTAGGTWDPGLISAGHHTQYDEKPDLDRFENADRWVAAMVERRARIPGTVWGDFTLDLQFRSVGGGVNPGTFTEIRNGMFPSLSVSNAGGSITLRNVTTPSLQVGAAYLSVYDSDISFSSEPSLTAFAAYDSRVASAYPWASRTMAVTMERCRVAVSFDRVTDNETLDAALRFTGCTFQENAHIRTKNLEMRHCETLNNSIKVYPYRDSDNVYRLKAVLEGNLLDNSEPVEFTKLDSVGGQSQENVYNVRLDWVITGNTFTGNDEGLRMRYWQNRLGSYWTRTFVAGGPSVHSVTYSGNTGCCPAENMRGSEITDSLAYTSEVVTGGAVVYKYAGTWLRCMYLPGPAWWNNSAIGGDGTLVKWYTAVESPYNELSFSMYAQNAWYPYPKSHDEQSANGDFFAAAILTFGDYIRIRMASGGSIIANVTAKVI